ncbi:Hsp70 family protein [Mycobacterium celatum]|uniref:Hsp70 family protein n=1 Tax=Mycobacterium celatum TaxID=28045 RepID=UPI0018DB4552|nr:Hsp70 family protein [Mycobacterium celatum]
MTRRSMLTVFPDRAPQLGVPTENADPAGIGTLISGFVERVGHSEAVVSVGGSTHDPALLLVEALDAMISAAGADASTSEITIAVPAHWEPQAVQALRDALRTHPGFVRSGIAPRLVSDAVTALIALNSGARLPARGVVGLLDFGGAGTNITLADAGSGFAPIGETLRYSEFSGTHIDDALLVHVLDAVGHTDQADPESTAAVSQLDQLREACRKAKERLSTETVTAVDAEVPGRRATVQVSRAQLETLIEDRLSGVFSAFDEALSRNKIDRADLAAVAMAGGGASIPLVAQRLSSHAKLSVVTAVQPALAMAVGAVMLASREPAEEQADEVQPATAMAAMASAATGSFAANTGTFDAPTGGFGTGSFGIPTDGAFFDEEPSSTLPKAELAWSEADDDAAIMPLRTGEYPAATSGTTSARPQLTFDHDEQAVDTRTPAEPWYRRPAVVVTGTALVVLAIIAAVMIGMRHTSGGGPIAPAPSVSTTAVPGTFAPGSESQAPTSATDTQAPSSEAPSSTESATTPPSSTTTTEAPTTTTTTTTSQAPTTTAPTTTQAPTTSQVPVVPTIPPIPRIPGIPQFLPQPAPPGG